MKYSIQQQSVIESDGNMVVNAVAGSGKTTTLGGYALARKSKSILYLAFNSSVRKEAQAKFAQMGLRNVRVETAHSLALGAFRSKKFSIYQGSYQPYDVKRILGFQKKDAIADMKFGSHVLKVTSLFCNSTASKVSEIDYLNHLKNPEERSFAQNVYDDLIHQSRKFLNMMKTGEIDMTHDFYLKLYQLRQPKLSGFEYILFDEAQDASPVMLDVFLNQPAVKVIVGDEHQQIYSWRHAVNALKSSDFDRKELNTSYRFNQEIADLAKSVLRTKNHMEELTVPNLKGVGGDEAERPVRATLGRTNGGILVDVIGQLIDDKTVSSVYFEGHFNSYTYADEGGSVYDVLNLYQGEFKRIRNPMIRQFNDFQELQEYTDQSGDAPMKGIIDIVMKYGKELPRMINCIKENHVDHEQKETADMIYSTVHKAKGMEYDQVTLLDDFLGEEKMIDLLERPDINPDPDRLLEDTNILYVGLTRTKSKLRLPASLIPADFEVEGRKSVEAILPVFNLSEVPLNEIGESKKEIKPNKASTSGKTYSYDEVRKSKPSAYSPWSQEEDLELEDLFMQRMAIKEMAEHFGRTRGAISSRIKKLQLREKHFDA